MSTVDYRGHKIKEKEGSEKYANDTVRFNCFGGCRRMTDRVRRGVEGCQGMHCVSGLVTTQETEKK